MSLQPQPPAMRRPARRRARRSRAENCAAFADAMPPPPDGSGDVSSRSTWGVLHSADAAVGPKSNQSSPPSSALGGGPTQRERDHREERSERHATIARDDKASPSPVAERARALASTSATPATIATVIRPARCRRPVGGGARGRPAASASPATTCPTTWEARTTHGGHA